MEECGLDFGGALEMGGMFNSALDIASGFEGVTDFTSQLDFSSLQENTSDISDVIVDAFGRRTRRMNLNVRQVGRQGRVLSRSPQMTVMNQTPSAVPASTTIQGPGSIQLLSGGTIQTVTQGVGPVQVVPGVPVQTFVHVPPPVPPPMAIQVPGPVQMPTSGVPQQMGLAQVQPEVSPQIMTQGPGPADVQPVVPPQMEEIQGSSPPQGPPVGPEVQQVPVQTLQTVQEQVPSTAQIALPAQVAPTAQVVQGPQAVYTPNQTVLITQPSRTVVAGAGTKPPNPHICLAWFSFIISLFACCWPFGLVSVKFANRAVLANRRRNYHKAESAGRQAKTFAIVAMVLTCITFAILIILIIIAAISNSNNSSSYSSSDDSYNTSY